MGGQDRSPGQAHWRVGRDHYKSCLPVFTPSFFPPLHVRRDRSEEKSVSESYLERLHQHHEDWLGGALPLREGASFTRLDESLYRSTTRELATPSLSCLLSVLSSSLPLLEGGLCGFVRVEEALYRSTARVGLVALSLP